MHLAISRTRRLILIGASAVAMILSGPTVVADKLANFITRRGDQLFDGERPFRFISWNIPNLMVIEDAYEFSRPNPWRWPDEFEIEDALESVRQMGGQVVRTYVVSVYREGSYMGECVHVLRPGEFNEEAFHALDKAIEVARRKGIRLIVPLVDQFQWWGGIGEYAAFRGKPADAFWTDRQIIDDFKRTIHHVLTRKNTLTGVRYRDEPAIFGWETGNEIEPPPEWTREIAAYIKELDPNHLVIDGKSLHGVPTESLDDPNVDVITTHHYPWGENPDFVTPIRAAHALTKGKKAYFVGEFGFVETPHIARTLQTVIDEGISGALLWSLRMHRREGGFYWHMEVGTGRNIYKAYHWPGFASGDEYDERQVMRLMRAKAYEIRGQEPPPLEPPARPKLLPIARPSAISWQGSAGASGYDVWRADDSGGPWQKVAANVCDADGQYRPLFNDPSATPGETYWYRVTARNEAGASEPSIIVGPVPVACRTLVDECRDLSLVHARHADVGLATENARTVQEDCHRFAMRPGSAVVYRLAGPIGRFRIYAFGDDDTTAIAPSHSADGHSFQPADVRQEAFPTADAVYGYRTPILFDGRATSSDARYLRIELPKQSAAVSEGDAARPPLEIGRIEIEYDSVPDRALPAQREAAAQPTPANSAIFVRGPHSIEQALAAIDQAAERGDRRLNVVVTILVDLTEDLRINSFGEARGADQQFQPYDDAMHDELRSALKQVFARMAEHGMDIYILPHIDSGGEVRAWRNWVDFDPLAPHNGYSYQQLMIDTIADALQETIRNEMRVEMALSGEMGTSLFGYPQSYREIVRQMRDRSVSRQLKFGISLNHNGIAGDNNPSGAGGVTLSGASRTQMQALIEECDFVGMSFYRPVEVHPTPDDFVRGIEHFMGEFHAHGLIVPTSKPLHFSEMGIGGGYRGKPTSDPAEAVQTPWEGTGNPHDNPWRHKAMRSLRRDYHTALLEFLRQQPARWQVSAAFFWSMGSWDPHGMWHLEFGDAQIIAKIRRHNLGNPATGN